MYHLKKLDTSEGEPVFLLELDNGARLRVSESAFKLLHLRQQGVSVETIAERLRASQPHVTPELIEQKHQDVLARIGAFEQRDQASTSNGFWFRLPLLPEPVVNRVAGFLVMAFQRSVAIILLGISVLTFFSPSLWIGKLSYESSHFWLGYGLFLVSLLFHELGHATACKRFGAAPAEIGFTVYLFYPSLYSDVSAAWQLPRWHRVVVDLGGIYFQLLVAGVFAFGFAETGWLPLKLAFLMIMGVAVFSLNPIFKFDGYWVLADSLGITHLSEQPWKLLRRSFEWLRGRSVEKLPYSSGILAFLAFYTIASFLFWGLFVWNIGPMLTSRFAALPGELAAFRGSPSASTLGTLLGGAFMAFFVLYLTLRMAGGVLAPVWRRFFGRSGAPVVPGSPQSGAPAPSIAT